MLVQERLLQAYQQRGYEVITGSMLHYGGDMIHEFTTIIKEGKRLHTGWGMSFGELSVLQMLSDLWRPERVFGVGVAFGWSTVALRLFFPAAKIACLDAGIEGPDNMAGIRLTEEILREFGPAALELGYSPQDTPRTIITHLDGRVNLVFIDGLHTNQQQLEDFRAAQPFLERDHVVLLHDVRFCQMQDSFRVLASEYPGRAIVMRRTTSGIGVLWSEAMDERMKRLALVFDGHPI